MADDIYEIYAIKYASNPRRSRAENLIYVAPDDPHDTTMPLDFFVWVAVGERRTIMIDSGASEGTCSGRGHDFIRRPADGLALLGIDAADIENLVTTHLHWDHGGNLEQFPNARLHVQRLEMGHATGPLMNEPFFRRPYDPDQIFEYLKQLYAGRVSYHEGEDEIAPGFTIRHVGGHTPGMQVVRVNTRRGWVVLAADSIHFYENILMNNPFPVLVNIVDYIAAWRTVEHLADSFDHVVPGHDPQVLRRYPAAKPGTEGIAVRLDVAPAPLEGVGT